MTNQDPMALISAAVERGIDPEQLGKLLDLQERWEKTRAREAFAAAILGFQTDCPAITKRREVKNNDGNTRYKFAGYEDIMAEVRPLLVRWKISHSFSSPETLAGHYCLVCHLQVGSHVENRPFWCKEPAILELAKAIHCNEAQAVGAWNSYTKRYAFCQALGIVVCGEDGDLAGKAAMLSEDQIRVLTNLMNDIEEIGKKKYDRAGFCEWLGAPNLADVPAINYRQGKQHLEGVLVKLQKGGRK